MATTAYERFRFLWGAVDWQSGSGSPYSTAQTANLGASAVAGVGARRVQLVIDRTLARAGVDTATMHFDILNMTGGVPDDTWTAADFAQCETALNTWWSASAAFIAADYKLIEYRWYKIGDGITKPNPAVRSTTLSTAGTGTGNIMIPQAACSLTFRTAVRHSWGRTYLPLGRLSSSHLTIAGELGTPDVDILANALNALVTNLATNDFRLVVWSGTKHALLNVEKVEVDSVLDVIRRRRWKSATYKKILP